MVIDFFLNILYNINRLRYFRGTWSVVGGEFLAFFNIQGMKNYRFKEDVCQTEYRLLQCADMVCSLELIKQRKQANEYIKSIDKFFESGQKYNKNYAKAFNKMEL